MSVRPDGPEASVLRERAEREPVAVKAPTVADHRAFGDRETRRTAIEPATAALEEHLADE